jgi:hypothetical protein
MFFKPGVQKQDVVCGYKKRKIHYMVCVFHLMEPICMDQANLSDCADGKQEKKQNNCFSHVPFSKNISFKQDLVEEKHSSKYITFTSDGNYLLLSDVFYNKPILIYDLVHECLHAVINHPVYKEGDGTSNIQISKDNKYLAVVFGMYGVVIWSLPAVLARKQTAACDYLFKIVHVENVAFSHDNKYILGSDDVHVKIYGLGKQEGRLL